MVQGYLLSRPLNAADCLRFLQEWKNEVPAAAAARLDPAVSPP